MSANKTLDPSIMFHFTGSETFYRHPLARKVVYTEGVQYVAETVGAYWLLDEIALMNMGLPSLALEAFQVWTLTVRPDSTATLACSDGNENIVYSKELTFTDFPQEGVTLWFQNNTILLPSEY